VAASSSRTPRTSSTGSSSAALSGPSVSPPLVAMPIAALARSRSESGTKAGTAARDPGWNTCPASARSHTRTNSQGSGGSQSAVAATRTPWTSSQPTMTRLRSSRSTRVPAKGPSRAGAKSPTSSSSATASARPVASATWSIKATRPSESPRYDTARALHSRRNGGLPASRRSEPARIGASSVAMPPILPNSPASFHEVPVPDPHVATWSFGGCVATCCAAGSSSTSWWKGLRRLLRQARAGSNRCPASTLICGNTVV
jgi:hypothetical protein